MLFLCFSSLINSINDVNTYAIVFYFSPLALLALYSSASCLAVFFFGSGSVSPPLEPSLNGSAKASFLSFSTSAFKSLISVALFSTSVDKVSFSVSNSVTLVIEVSNSSFFTFNVFCTSSKSVLVTLKSSVREVNSSWSLFVISSNSISTSTVPESLSSNELFF